MYNEVFLKCPRCGKSCTEQISQVTLGFGGFDLDNPESLAAALDEQQLSCTKDFEIQHTPCKCLRANKKKPPNCFGGF
jgi:hypothetical protein